MAECKSPRKSGPTRSSNSSMGNILKILLAAFNLMKQPADTLPPPLLLIGSKLRPGLSARDMASRVISRFSEADAVGGEIFQGGNNVMTALEVIRMEEIVNAIQTEMKISTVIQPAAITSVVTGSAGPYPVAATATNVNIVSTDGIAQ